MVTEMRLNVYITRLLPALLKTSNNHFFFNDSEIPEQNPVTCRLTLL